jgi:hypothetical protein
VLPRQPRATDGPLGLVHAQRGREIFVNPSSAATHVQARRVHLTQGRTTHGTAGSRFADPERAADLALAVRVPGWSRRGRPAGRAILQTEQGSAPLGRVDGRKGRLNVNSRGRI